MTRLDFVDAHLVDRIEVVDLGVRYDRIRFGVSGHEWIDYDWSRGTYVDGVGPVDTGETYTAFSPRVDVVQKLNEASTPTAASRREPRRRPRTSSASTPIWVSPG